MDKETTQPARREFDIGILFATFVLVGIGLVMIFSATSQNESSLFFLKRQAIFAALGTTVMVVVSRVPYETWRKLSILFTIALMGLVILTLIPGIGSNVKGASRWLSLGGFSLQPTEFLKVALVMFLAAFMAKRNQEIRDFKRVIQPILVLMVAISILVMLQPDLGTTAILWAIAFVMVFLGGANLKHFFVPVVLIVIAGCIAISFSGYRSSRIDAFLKPWQTEQTSGHQVTRSLMAYGTGGIKGKGLSNGELKRKHLPEAHTDFIFPVLAEELGLWGVLGALSLYGALLWRAFAIGARTKDPFGSLLAMGLTSVIAIQVVLNIAVTMKLIPPTGLTLPLMSYGGSSLLCTMGSIGIILNVGHRSEYE